jgi:hypothetical protein
MRWPLLLIIGRAGCVGADADMATGVGAIVIDGGGIAGTAGATMGEGIVPAERRRLSIWESPRLVVGVVVVGVA